MNYKLSTLLLVLLFTMSWTGFSQTTTYNYTGSVQTYVVPGGLSSITVTAQGAKGGLNSTELSTLCSGTLPDRPGYGACVVCTLAVVSGQVLNIYVGGRGGDGTRVGCTASAGIGGYNGGANGAVGYGPYSGGGGGGASDIRIGGTAFSDRVVVAGGGGGAGGNYYYSTDYERGGDGGTTTGEDGYGGGSPHVSGGAYGGGPSSGGAPGSYSGWTTGTAGSFGLGGAAGSPSGGGGGGGGWYGGGGGCWGGGGGGSSYTSSSIATNVAHTRGCNSVGDGVVTITPNCSAGTIGGPLVICPGTTGTLTNGVSGGTWTSSNTGVATIGSTTGDIVGVSAGTSMITYFVTLPCGSVYSTAVLRVNPSPGPISGTTTMCVGLTTTLTDGGGGTWASSNTGVATVGSSTGIVTGVSAGTSVITYSVGFGMSCLAFTTVTVTPLPAPITGSLSVCVGLTTSLGDATPGGTWSSGSTGVATIGSASGIATGVSTGTSIITYTIGTGCIMTATLLVNPLPAPITGRLSMCVGLTTSLSDVTPGGTWSSGNTAIATVGTSSGIVTGVSAGTALITYTIPTGCIITAMVTVNPLPLPITGTLNVCVGLTTTLGDPTPGGTWSSSNLGVATIGSLSGIATGVTAGTAIITYTIGSTCIITATLLVNPLPTVITGLSSVCVAATITLTDGTPGGVWSSSNTAVATVGSLSGIVTGVSSGLATITYRLPTGCVTTTDITVYPIPAPITGITSVCEGLTRTLADASPFGSWSTSDATIASVDATTGVVTGVLAGTVTITYAYGTGCGVTTTFTVNPSPNPITGVTAICLGYTSLLTDAGGGTWSSSNTAVAPIGSTSGIVSGLTLGFATITYTLPTGCITTVLVTVNPLPDPITGTTRLCVGTTTTLRDAVPGGDWSSSNPAVAPVITTLGLVTGLSAGTAIITYTLSTGCYVYTTVTVIPTPGAITGTASLCVGGTTSLSNTVGGGTWISSRTAVATVGSLSGIVTGVSAGTSIITYSMGAGCQVTRVVTVSPSPVAITGTTSICIGNTTALFDATPGGTWSSSNTAVGTISGIGVVGGVSAGTTVITYTVGGTCFVTTTVTVNSTPTSITGSTNVCVGQTGLLGNGVPGGIWTSSNTAVATIGSTTGILNGVTVGTATITYSLGAGCVRTTTIAVNPSPGVITGSMSVCVGFTSALSNSVSGGTWTSSATGVATVGLSTGIVTGVATGTAIITYRLATGCETTATVTVNTAPGPILGTTSLCAGTSLTLSNSVTGGLWTSSNTAIATVGSTTGVVNGVAAGTATITYSLGIGCAVTAVIAVNTAPTVIGGPSALCVGSTMTLTNGVPGGRWTSSNTAIATIGSISGIVSGVALGTAEITYTLAGGCTVSTTITVSPTPGPITGSGTLCVGSSTPYGNIVPGGLWSTTSATISIGSISGIVTGLSIGTASITYSLGSGCTAYRTITVTPGPAAIAGASSVCEGGSATYTDATPGGDWASSNTAVATIGSLSGILTAVSAGTTVITYTTGVGCMSVKIVTVNATPTAITGTAILCSGTTTTLADAVSGGIWSSGNTAVATVGSLTGVVFGVSAGTAVITYATGAGCYATRIVTVTPSPAPIGGIPVAGIGTTTSLTNTVGGGVWTSSNTGVATVGSSSGIVTGVSLGTTIITYTVGSCFTTTTVTITNAPTPIGGPRGLCLGSCYSLTDGVGGGVWTSSNPAVATIGSSTGLVCAVSLGTSVITYSVGLGLGLSVTATVTVNPSPLPITGPTELCVGTIIVCGPPTSGTWSSSSTSAIINPTTGVVTGVSAGTTTITFMLSGGCYAVRTLTVHPTPTAISGTANVCRGQSTTLINGLSGGSWISSNTVVATIGSTSGIVNGLAAGTSTITYSLGTSCIATRVVTVYPSAPIAGITNICVGNTTTLTNAVPGGNWLSDLPSVATIGLTSGLTSGVSAGTATISYTLSTGCRVTTTVTVNGLPDPIAGPASVCVGSSITFTDVTPGGTWSYSGAGVATIGSTTGILTGLSAGPIVIAYSIGSGCSVIMGATINPLPLPITGATNGCEGSLTRLSDITPGGLWSSSDIAIADIGSITGIVNGVAAGTSTITYTLPTGCFVTRDIAINPLPAAIVGSTRVCVGLATALSNPTPGGEWQSSNTLIATIGSSTGMVTGVSAGVATISYIMPTSCYITTSVTVVPLPAPVTGPANVCVGSNITLSDVTPGGIWTSTNPTIATIGSTSGILTGASSGTVLVSYTLGSGCSALATIIVNPVSPINGPSAVCVGQRILLSDTTAGGVWTSSNLTVATVVRTGDTIGTVAGLTAGTAIISYTLPTGCIALKSIRVVAAPPAIIGLSQVCEGATITLSDPIFGGTWTSDNIAVATVGISSGIVTGVSAGVATISYNLGGCPATKIITVNPLPAAIAGGPNVCVGAPVTFTSATPGGTWSSSSTGIAVVGAGTGIVTGITAGTATITYRIVTGCVTTVPITVFPAPARITGNANICIGLSTALADATPGGAWSSSDPATVWIDGTGVAYGLALGTATISYTVGSGCSALLRVTVNDLPPAITGATNVCVGQSVTFADAAPGGAWTSGDLSVASVGASTGIVTGVAAGIAPITYTLGTGCIAVKDIIVDPLPGPIVGIPQVCVGLTTPLYSSTFGGGWSSSNTTIATVDASTGVVTGVSAGTATITYSVGCYQTITVRVNPMPTAITGNTNICLGSTSALTNGVPGGIWTSSIPGSAPIGSSTGVVTGVAIGTGTIAYTLGASCSVSTTVAVLPLPTVYTVYGTGSYCEGGNGIHIYLSGSSVGVNYLLYNGGTTPTGTFAGTGALLDFGLQTVAGDYHVVAISSITLCRTNMAGIATITINPAVRPAVTITNPGSDTICAGASTTYTANPTNGGSAPAYVWTVNGVTVGTAGAYTFIPADGDVVKVLLTSNALCAIPDTATRTKKITVSPMVNPVSGIVSHPGDTVCKDMAITLTATPTYGGYTPSFIWRKFGLNVSAGPTYSYIPSDGDQITCFMTSSYPCLLTDTVTSPVLLVNVVEPTIPHVMIVASPSYNVGVGKPVTLTAEVTDAGLHPTYQWLVNGVPVAGATTASYTSVFHSAYQDSVSVDVTSSGVCQITAHNWMYINVSDVAVKTVGSLGGDISVLPNPNKGTFTIKGTIAIANGMLDLEITNMLGQVVHRSEVTVRNGKVNEQVSLSSSVASGMYIINLRSATESKIFHMVIEQ